jgi:Zn-dependent peptidase ImmA (M78 family)
LTDVLYKQAWYRDYLLEQGVIALPFVGKFTVEDGVQEIADDMAKTLHLTGKDRNNVGSWEAFLRLLINHAEDAGIWVMRSGIVGNNTHRPLDVQEFRGFAVVDPVAPLVFINGKDAKAAQIFTLAHELAHIWLGQSAISNINLDAPLKTQHRSLERKCNAIAAELLTPQADFVARWRHNQTLANNAQNLATHFRVSTVVIARRALELGFVDWNEFQTYYRKQVSIWRKQAEQKDKKASRGNFYRTLPVRNGKHFTEAVLISASERRLLLRDAGRLLGIQPSKLVAFAKETDLG